MTIEEIVKNELEALGLHPVDVLAELEKENKELKAIRDKCDKQIEALTNLNDFILAEYRQAKAEAEYWKEAYQKREEWKTQKGA